MANVETLNPKQNELAARFVAAYAAKEGDAYAADVILKGRKNHRMHLTLPGEDGHTEYTYTEMENYISELEAGLESVAAPATEKGNAMTKKANDRFATKLNTTLEEVKDEPTATEAAPQEPEQEQDSVDEVPEQRQGGEDTEQDKGGASAALKEKLAPKTKSDAIPNLLAEMLKRADAGTRGKLGLGQDLLTLDTYAKEEGLNQREAVALAEEFFAGKGRKFPNRSDRSRMRTTAEVWLEKTGYDLDTELTSNMYRDDEGNVRTTAADKDELVPIPVGSQDVVTLYTVRHLVKPGDDDHNADVLAMTQMFAYRPLTKIAKHLTSDNFSTLFPGWAVLGAKEGEAAAIIWADGQEGVKVGEPEFKSIGGISAPLVDQFKGQLKEDMTNAAIKAGAFQVHDDGGDNEATKQVSHTFQLEILMELWNSMSDRRKELTLKNMHGNLTQAESKELLGS